MTDVQQVQPAAAVRASHWQRLFASTGAPPAWALVSVPWAAAHIAVGCVAGLLVAFGGTAFRGRHEPDEVRAARMPMPIAPILASLRSFDEHARDGVRRAVPLAILMQYLQADGGRDAFWIFFAAFLVLLTPGKTPRDLAAARVGSTVFGVLPLGVASLIVSNERCAVALVATYLLWPRDREVAPTV